MLWSLLFVGLLLTVAAALGAGAGAGRRPAHGCWSSPAPAFLIAVNWLVFVYGVNSGHVVETSLGYFINPLVSVLLGVVVFSERLRPLQWVGGGHRRRRGRRAHRRLRPPAVDRAGPGGQLRAVRRDEEAGPGRGRARAVRRDGAGRGAGRASSSACCTPTGTGTFGNARRGPRAAAGELAAIATAIPLLLFAAAARRIPLSTVGLLQYLTPLMQLAIGVFVYDEPMPPARLAGFVIVWVALAVFTVDSLRHARAGSRRPAAEAVPAGL